MACEKKNRRFIGSTILHSQSGLSAIEYVVALIIIMIVFTGWLKLTSNAIKDGYFVKKFADAGNLAQLKANELSANAVVEVGNIPAGQTKAGAIAPLAPRVGYFDEFDDAGNPVTISKGVPVFRRQWSVIKDDPYDGDISFVVSVSYIGGAGKVIRLAKIVNTEASITSGN